MKDYPNGAIKGNPGIDGLSERLKCVREMRQLTQAQLAKKLGTSPSHVSNWETGIRLPTVKNIRSLSLALETSVDYLLDSQ